MNFRYALYFLILIIAFFVYKFFSNSNHINLNLSPNSSKLININNDGLKFDLLTSAATVEDFLKENKINLNEHDYISLEKNSPLFYGTNIAIKKARKIKIEVDGKIIDGYALSYNIREAILENNITLGRLDKAFPDFNALPTDNLKIAITRINVEEKIIPEDIDFKIISKNDSKLGWREKKVEQTGEKGIREVNYRITYKNGKEISRVALSKNITKEPVNEINIQGTYMKLGKADKGQGTWYVFKDGLFAASTTLPRDSYAKVTNVANGKSVVVQINDYGPQGKGRIIDLDKVAFAKIASIGAGVIGVKVEAILN